MKQVDREKVIAWLADEELYYIDHGDTHNSLMACNALALLKQEAVKPRRDANCVRMFRCGACGEYVGFIDSAPGNPNEQDNYCRNCGKQVKWE